MKRVIAHNLPVKTIVILIISVVSLFACNNNKDKNYTRNTNALYVDYQVTGKEGDDNLTVLLQYRMGGEDGDGISMDSVMLDGELLLADSTKMNGIFYELHKPIAGFAGTHSILFTDINKKGYKEEFNFQPVVLSTPVADTIQRNDFALELEGLETKDYVRVLMTDTSFINNGINRVDAVTDGHLMITKADLETLANGPVQLELIREYERRVKNDTGARGRLLITYSLKREFFLKD